MSAATEKNADEPVLVGVDGSECSGAALRWAARYARLTGTPLTVMAVWHYPANFGWSPPMPDDWDPETDARTLLDQEVEDVLGPSPDLEVTKLVAEGDPGRAIAEASKTASLVVVGNRGRGQVAGVLLGSVSEYLTAHAHCPVVVVRERAEDEQASSELGGQVGARTS